MNTDASEITDDSLAASLPRYRLFILGSGFSKPAGHPLGVELLNMVRTRMREQFRANDWDGPLEREISEWTALYPNREVTLESVLAYSHRKHFLKLIGSDEYFEHGSRTIASAKPIIQEILSKDVETSSKRLYERFCAALTPYDLVLTFNYDTVLEDTFDRLGIAYSLSPEWWLDDEKRENLRHDYKAEFIDVLKLHGSIDWYDRRYYDESRAYYKSVGADVLDKDPLFGANAWVPIEPLNRGAVRGEYGLELLSRVFRVPNHRQYFPFRSGSFSEVPFLLPPAYDKILGHDPIRELWSNMHRTMDSFSAIIMIGYSMPLYDSYAYEALGKLILDYQAGGDKNYWGQPRTSLQIVTLADSDRDVLKGIPFLNSHNTRIWHDGFTEDAIDWMNWGD